MASRNGSSSRCISPIPIGNCRVTIDAHNFVCKSDRSSLQIFLSRSGSVKISVVEEVNQKPIDNFGKGVYEWRDDETCLHSNDEYLFILVNPKDAECSSKSYIQEVLKMYKKELPAMNYAANTGKESPFLERCVSKGKYCTLLLKSKSLENSEVIAAITYQIVPADTQHAEIPLAAVSSLYQHKGIGPMLYMELRRRLTSVGVRTIYCWSDKESEGFWFKQGFVSIAEVDTKGRARKLHIKTAIRKTLCFPGGSTLMVSHLTNDILADTAESLKSFLPLKLREKCLSLAAFSSENDGIPNTQNQMIVIAEGSEPEELVNDGISREYEKLGEDCNKISHGEDFSKFGGDDDVKPCSCSAQGAKRRVWEVTSSLKSKKVKGSQRIDCQLDPNWGQVPGSDITDFLLHGCSLGLSKDKDLVEVIPADLLTSSCTEKSTDECRPVNLMSEVLGSKEKHPKKDRFKIMLMNIADDSKKTNLTKVIEDLRGVVMTYGCMSTHIVTGKVRTTLNFCTALCSGAWIVSPSWLKQSFREGRFVDELPYILRDEDYLLKYKAELKDTVLRAKASPRALLVGYNVCIAAHVQPPAKILSAIVSSAGGYIVDRIENVYETSKTIFVACEEEMEEALFAVRKGIWTFSSEWLMNCIMRQYVDLEAPQFAESL